MSNTQHAARNILPETIQKAIERHALIPDGANVVVGVSGGADSVALLRALHQLGIPCTVAHMNHRLRGAASDADERFVRELAEELQCPVAVKAVEVRKLTEASGLSIEMAARQARHEFYAEFGQAVIALGHQADDQVETFLLRLARGAGADGLGGMPFRQQIGPIRLIRPMLEIPRSAILQWLEENGCAWRDDASNADEAFLRNRVRHTILPLLEKELNPNLRETLLRTMAILRDENEWMEEQINEHTLLDARAPRAARRRSLRKWLFAHDVEEIGFDAVEQILALMERGEGTTVFDLNDRQRVVVEYGTPRFEEGGIRPPEGEWKLTVEKGTGWRKDHGRGAGILPAEASFAADRVGDAAIEVRAWRPGDRIAPLGMQGTRKLQDILTDQKIPLAKRAHIPVVICRGEIIWLPGYRIARGWEVDGEKGKSIHVRIE
jgi:tRNA(Ile)-lysidine synthase